MTYSHEQSTVLFSEYPRPQFVRDSYYCLNGVWDLEVRHNNQFSEQGHIIVPFPLESDASECEMSVCPGDTLIYRRCFIMPDGFRKDRVLLHFGAVDQQATVFVNDVSVGEHTGGYLPFSMDITDVLCEGQNEICVHVADPLDLDIPYGKQRRKRGGMWYTPISGIWQTVWLESVPHDYIRSIRITPTLDHVTIEVEGGTDEKCLTFDGETHFFRSDRITFPVCNPKHWTPETPHLYPITLQSGEDIIYSYFALRTLSIETVDECPRILLNGKPYFFNGLLDQGYFADGIYLPSSEEGYRADVQLTKELGFNTLRKHIKLEPEAFYYECDRQGVIVFQDMVNNGRYSFLRDTALPTIGFRREIPKYTSAKRKRIFEQHCRDTIAHLYNHPCVCYYTIFNEGWGQFDADRLYAECKKRDSTRIWDATSGWFFKKDSDVQSEHVYFKPVKVKTGKRPLILSEFGGYSCKISGHAFNLDKTYGYRHFETPEELTQALVTLYREEIIPAVKSGLCGAILTQLSDVEDEVNGFVTYDRQVVKVDKAMMREVNNDIRAVFEQQLYK